MMWTYIENGSITSVKGFTAAGIHCGLKKKKKDLALVLSDAPCSAAGTFTLNKVKAAPIVISKNMIESQNKVKAILVNSGNANACTGEAGYNDALEVQKECADKLELKPEEVIISSTGVIGERMNMEAYHKGINNIVTLTHENGGIDASEAIMTTDLKKKHLAMKVSLSFGEVTIGAIAKGSGMIMPNMATMLAFIATDANIGSKLLQKMLSESVNSSFNKISVDGETSTNDMVVLLSNHKSEIYILDNTQDAAVFQAALTHLLKELAKSITADGEGATKLITIQVDNAKSKSDADAIGKTLSNSPLVKTAINGSDANWGRIISAVGNSGAEIVPEQVTIKFGDITILDKDYEVMFNEAEAKKVLSEDKVTITVDLNQGNESTTWWTCDFSEEYIKINSSYRS